MLSFYCYAAAIEWSQFCNKIDIIDCLSDVYSNVENVQSRINNLRKYDLFYVLLNDNDSTAML
jgi:hypothetical protein